MRLMCPNPLKGFSWVQAAIQRGKACVFLTEAYSLAQQTVCAHDFYVLSICGPSASS